MERQQDFFQDDIHLIQVARQTIIEREVIDFQKRIEEALTIQELKDIAGSISKVPLRELAEYGSKVMSILQYNFLK